MPVFKSNLDIQQNQLLNAVLHKLRDLPPNPVAGQLYYNEGKGLAYLYDGQYWIPWGYGSGGGGGSEVRQYMLTIPNPSTKSSMVFVRLYENQDVVRIDSHFSTESRVEFIIQSRSSVNDPGASLTADPIQALYTGSETTAFVNSSLPKDNWLYFELIQKDGGAIVPKDGEPVVTPVEGDPTATAVDGEILGLLTITITCLVT